MKKLYLHIGYPKCASTFLQKEIFKKIKNYYSSSNQNLSKILSIKIHNFNS